MHSGCSELHLGQGSGQEGVLRGISDVCMSTLLGSGVLACFIYSILFMYLWNQNSFAKYACPKSLLCQAEPWPALGWELENPARCSILFHHSRRLWGKAVELVALHSGLQTHRWSQRTAIYHFLYNSAHKRRSQSATQILLSVNTKDVRNSLGMYTLGGWQGCSPW